MKYEMNKTYHFAWTEVGTTPRRGVCCAAVEATSADTICKFRVGVRCVHDRGRWLSRNRVMVTVICCARRMNRGSGEEEDASWERECNG